MSGNELAQTIIVAASLATVLSMAVSVVQFYVTRGGRSADLEAVVVRQAEDREMLDWLIQRYQEHVDRWHV